MKSVKVFAEIELPDVPESFLYGNAGTLEAGAIDDNGLRTIGRLWTEELLKVAEMQRKE